MIFYILLAVVVLSLSLFCYKYPTSEKKISLILFVIMVLIGGFRDRIGGDYNSYMNWYIKRTRDDGFEFGFLAIMKVFRYLNLDYHFLFFFFSFFTYLFAYLGVRKYTKKSALPLVLYFLIPFLFLFSFIYIRQFLSVTIAFYAFSYLLEKKYIIYFLLMILGVSIHYSCLIPFLVFLIVFKWGEFVKIRHLFLLMVLTFIIGQIGISQWLDLFFKGSNYHYYVSNQSSEAVPLISLLQINAVFFFLIIYYDSIGFQYSNQKYLFLVYFCAMIFLNLFCESRSLVRVCIYFRVFEIILFAEIILDVIVKRRFYILGFICCFYLYPYFRTLQNDNENTIDNLKLIPYKTILFSDFK